MMESLRNKFLRAPEGGSAAAGVAATGHALAPRSTTMLQIAGWLVLAVALLAFPATASGYLLFMATLVAINVIATAGLNITVGYAGLLSIGHSAFIGVGAYASTLMSIHLGTPLFINLIVGGLAAFVVGLIFGAPSLRIKGVYLAIATLAAQYSLYFIFQQWTPVTGGDRGLSVPGVDLSGRKSEPPERCCHGDERKDSRDPKHGCGGPLDPRRCRCIRRTTGSDADRRYGDANRRRHHRIG
jgi:hypothetical protein